MAQTDYVPALRYDWLTRFYDFLLAITFPEKKIKKALIKQCGFNDRDEVLDFGTGTATLSIMIKQQYPSLSLKGIDVDKKILEIAERKVHAAGLHIDLIQYDGSHIPLTDASIMKVVSTLVFHHIPTENKKIVLKEICRVLKPGGELHIADFGRAKTIYTKIAFEVFRRIDGEENTRVNSKGLLPQFIRDAGFRSVTQTIDFNTAFGAVTLIKAVK